MTRFELAIAMKDENEHDGAAPNDPGGDTAYGLSSRAYPAEFKHGKPTRERVAQIMRRDFWDVMRCDEIADAPIALEMFDWALNSGDCRMVVRHLQTAYNTVFAGLRPKIGVDGVVGDKETLPGIARLNQEQRRALYAMFVHYRVGWYASRSAIQTRGWTDRRGWLARCMSGVRWA